MNRSDRRSFLAALAVIAYALTLAPAHAAEPVFPLNSRIGLVTPPGFTQSTRFTGFVNEADSVTIALAELPGDAYEEMAKTFSREAYAARGMTVRLLEPMTLADGRGTMLVVERVPGARHDEARLLAQVAGVTAVVLVQMTEEGRATLTDDALRDMLETVVVRQVPESEKLGVLPYRLGNLAGFRVVRTAGDGGAFLTEGPDDAVSGVTQPSVLIGIANAETPRAEDRDNFARYLLRGMPGIKSIRITRAEPLRISQGPGYEILAEAKDEKSGVDVTLVQWLRFGQSRHLHMLAIARRDAWNDVFTRLRAIRDGIELR